MRARKCTQTNGRGLEGALEKKTRAQRHARKEGEGSKARSKEVMAQRRARKVSEGSKARSKANEGSKARSKGKRGLKGALERR